MYCNGRYSWMRTLGQNHSWERSISLNTWTVLLDLAEASLVPGTESCLLSSGNAREETHIGIAAQAPRLPTGLLVKHPHVQ